jgi:hypothetical protein
VWLPLLPAEAEAEATRDNHGPWRDLRAGVWQARSESMHAGSSRWNALAASSGCEHECGWDLAMQGYLTRCCPCSCSYRQGSSNSRRAVASCLPCSRSSFASAAPRTPSHPCARHTRPAPRRQALDDIHGCLLWEAKVTTARHVMATGNHGLRTSWTWPSDDFACTEHRQVRAISLIQESVVLR